MYPDDVNMALNYSYVCIKAFSLSNENQYFASELLNLCYFKTY